LISRQSRIHIALRLAVASIFVCIAFAVAICQAEDLRLGIVGTDSSHSVEFTRILNDVAAKDHIRGARVVAAYRGGNPSRPLSRDRIERFSTALKEKWSIPFVDTIGDLCSKIDGILILSVDPLSRVHEFEQAATCHKPVFLDKPAAATADAVVEIAGFAEQHHIVWFSASALRFAVPQQSTAISSADVWGPGDLGKIEDGYPLDLAWYGIHSIEALYGVMGPGITQVSRVHTTTIDIITAVWGDGRVGTVHLVRPDVPFSILLNSRGGTNGIIPLPTNYAPLVQSIVTFVGTKTQPVSTEQMLEVFAVMEASQKSMQNGCTLTKVSPLSLR
jgi:hypothetical protein